MRVEFQQQRCLLRETHGGQRVGGLVEAGVGGARRHHEFAGFTGRNEFFHEAAVAITDCP